MSVNAVSGVSGATPIDWSKYTAKQLLQLQEQGVGVPSEYLNWAREFINDVNNSYKEDVMTYEMAHITASNVVAAPMGMGNQDEIGNFYKELNESDTISTQDIIAMEKAMAEALDDTTENYLDRASSITDSIDSIKDDTSIVGRMGLINSYNSVLKSIGSQAQSRIASDVQSYEQNEKTMINFLPDSVKGLSLAGAMKGDIKEALAKACGKLAETVKKGKDQVKDDLADAVGYKRDVGRDTGVYVSMNNQASATGNESGGQNPSNNNGEASTNTVSTTKDTTAKTDEKNTNVVIKEKKDESTKANKVAQNDGTDKNDKLHTDLEAIMQYKIRTGKINTES